MGKFSPFIATVTDAAIITLANYVQAFSGYGGHHHGSPALAAWQAAAPKSLETNLWSTFKSSSSVSERHAVKKAKQNLAQQILAKNPSLIEYETGLSQVQLKAIQDEDAIAQASAGNFRHLNQSQLPLCARISKQSANHALVSGCHQAASQ